MEYCFFIAEYEDMDKLLDDNEKDYFGSDKKPPSFLI
jgi:hypothetical protein